MAQANRPCDVRPTGKTEERPTPPLKPVGSDERRETIEECILRSLNEYFATLNGAKPHPLHEMVLEAAERPVLTFAMKKAGGNQSAAAELLGINRNTLRKKLTEYHLDG